MSERNESATREQERRRTIRRVAGLRYIVAQVTEIGRELFDWNEMPLSDPRRAAFDATAACASFEFYRAAFEMQSHHVLAVARTARVDMPMTLALAESLRGEPPSIPLPKEHATINEELDALEGALTAGGGASPAEKDRR